RWSRRRRRKREKRRLHQRVTRACSCEFALQARAIKSEQPAKHYQPRRDGPRDPAKRSASRRHWNYPFTFRRYLAHDALLQRGRWRLRWSAQRDVGDRFAQFTNEITQFSARAERRFERRSLSRAQ